MKDFHITTGSIKRRRYRFREPEVLPLSEDVEKNLKGLAGSELQDRFSNAPGRTGDINFMSWNARKHPEGEAVPYGRAAFGHSVAEPAGVLSLGKSFSAGKEETSRHITKERILLMDDDASVREITGQILTYLGYAVDLASTGEEAIALFRQAQSERKPFSQVILDLTIRGGMGGFKTLKKLREVNPQIRAIIISGYTNDPVIEFFDTHGFNASLTKPFTIRQLQSALSSKT